MAHPYQPHHRARALALLLLPLAAALLGLLAPPPAAAQVGVAPQRWTVPDADGGRVTVPGMLFYPTAATATPQRWGPFSLTVAPGAVPTPGPHPLVLISHGTGGHELGHAWLAQGLAEAGYVVVTLRHPGDNYESRSAVGTPAYFAERPRQAARVLDALLADARWAPLIDGGRIAAIGHSAGGHTVLALAGLPVDAAGVARHCSTQGTGLQDDAVLCRLGGFSAQRPSVAAPPAAQPALLRDARVRAVVADAPMTLALRPDVALPAIPVLIEYGSADAVLVPRFHAERLCAAAPALACVRSAGAGHFALFQAGTGALGAPSGDAEGEPSHDPAGFDRAAWQAQAVPRIRAFLDRALAPSPAPAAAPRP